MTRTSAKFLSITRRYCDIRDDIPSSTPLTLKDTISIEYYTKVETVPEKLNKCI
jgi:hypothetical protein